MGNRANVNIITEKVELGDNEYFKVLNIYSHWGGSEAQRVALDWVETHGMGRIDDPSYFSRGVIVAMCHEDYGASGSGVDIRICETIEEASSQISDNEHNILTFDLVNKNIIIASAPNWNGEASEIIDVFSLDDEGIENAKMELD